MNFFNAAVNLGLGFEREFAGTSAFVLSLNYYIGFVNALKEESSYINKAAINSSGKSEYSEFKQTVKSH